MELEKLREEIDQLDEELIDILNRRDEVVRRIAAAKAAHKRQVLDPKREEALYRRVRQISRRKDMDGEYIRNLFQLILQHSRKIQNAII